MGSSVLFLPKAIHHVGQVTMNKPRLTQPCRSTLLVFAIAVLACPAVAALGAGTLVPQFTIYEQALQHAGQYANPYVELSATAELTPPAGRPARSIPLFWDGGDVWKFRFAPDLTGTWQWVIHSSDSGLDGESGHFVVGASDARGSIQPMRNHPHHFQTQGGSPFWFLGDTAWALYTDNMAEGLSRKTALEYVDVRAGQGFNVLHSMLMSEAGWGNQGGPPFSDIGAERINPRYWQEVDVRLAHVNRMGMIAGLALAWGNKGRGEKYAWNRFPSDDARKRYARYIAARYSAFNVYFIVAGEWHAEIRTTPKATADSVRQEFIAIGDALHASDPHHRMIAIHPMTAQGSVREFVGTGWMAFGDYQQNYRDLHRRVLLSRKGNLPVVNSEYGYYLRDQDGDGLPDKSNSMDADSMRHASWDIAMEGGYLVKGFGTTYFGGNRDPGPFDVHAKKNTVWDTQIGALRKVFTSLPWWLLKPSDDLITADVPRGKDGMRHVRKGARRGRALIEPPATTYWMLADRGNIYVAYVRGARGPFHLRIDTGRGSNWEAEQFDPRTGRRDYFGRQFITSTYEYQPPDDQDWVLVLRRR